jgi:hypothetical protein
LRDLADTLEPPRRVITEKIRDEAMGGLRNAIAMMTGIPDRNQVYCIASHGPFLQLSAPQRPDSNARLTHLDPLPQFAATLPPGPGVPHLVGKV